MRVSVAPRFRQLSLRRLSRFSGLFLDNLRENRVLMVLGVGSGLGAVAMRLLRPWPVKLLFDGVLIPNDRLGEQPYFAWLLDKPIDLIILVACAGLLAVTLLWSLFSYAQTYLTARAGQLAVYSLRQRVYSHLMRLSLGFHQRRRRGDLVMRLTGDINLLRDMMVDSALLATSEALMLAFMIVVMLFMDVPLALAALSILPLMALTTLRFSIRIREAARRQRRNEGRVAAMVSEMLRSVHVIQAFGREDHQEDRFQRGNRMSLKAGLKTTRLEASMSRIVEVLLAIGTASVLWLGVHRVRAGVLTPGDLLVFTSYLHSSYRPLRKLARVASRMSKAVVCADRVVEVLSSEPKVVEAPDAKKARDIQGLLEFRRLSFDYRGGGGIHRIGFVAQPGQLIGIAGPSGAGKSTILALALRLYDPKKGKILLDGRHIQRLRLKSLRDQITVVLQDPMIFGTTIRENIAFGALDAGDDDVERAAKLANAHEFICDLPDGYETVVAEAGTTLSAGQRQRLSIARAFLRDSPILLMDEPTQALDAAGEREVSVALRRLMRGRTTIIAAHKLDTLRDAAEILVLKRGKVLERGTHEELIEQGGWYSRGWAIQNGGGPAVAPADSDARSRKVVEFEPRWHKRDDHLRISASGGSVPHFDPAILDGDAVADALARAGVRGREEGSLRLSRAWPYPKIGLVALYEDPGGASKYGLWGIHAVSGRVPGLYREALRRGTAARLDSLGAIAHAFPEDPYLIGLDDVIRAKRAEKHLSPWFLQSCEEWVRLRAGLVTYKPARRCVVRYRLELPAGGGKTLYGKSFPVGGAEEVAKLYTAFRRQRSADGSGGFQVARPVGLVSGLEMILWRKVSGVTFHEQLATDRAASLAGRIGASLANLHASSTAWRRLHGREREFGTTTWWGGTAATAFSERRVEIERAHDSLRRLAERAEDASLVPSHRDLHDKQVLIRGDTTKLLDLETACRAEPELDVANFLAHLELRGLQGFGDHLGVAAEAFAEAYSQQGPAPDAGRLAFYRASALLRLSFVYALRAGGWSELSSALLQQAQTNYGSDKKLVGE